MLAYNYTCNDVGYGATTIYKVNLAEHWLSIKPVECL